MISVKNIIAYLPELSLSYFLFLKETINEKLYTYLSHAETKLLKDTI
jgi:hypothetical protein